MNGNKRQEIREEKHYNMIVKERKRIDMKA